VVVLHVAVPDRGSLLLHRESACAQREMLAALLAELEAQSGTLVVAPHVLRGQLLLVEEGLVGAAEWEACSLRCNLLQT